jgi:dTDP-4-dehydrorhamnose reductase
MVAEVTMKAIKNDLKGLWHLIPCGFVSRFDWAKKINEMLNLNVDVVKASQSDFNSPAKRPEFSAMSNSKIKKDLSVDIKSWEEYLYDYLS